VEGEGACDVRQAYPERDSTEEEQGEKEEPVRPLTRVLLQLYRL